MSTTSNDYNIDYDNIWYLLPGGFYDSQVLSVSLLDFRETHTPGNNLLFYSTVVGSGLVDWRKVCICVMIKMKIIDSYK